MQSWNKRQKFLLPPRNFPLRRQAQISHKISGTNLYWERPIFFQRFFSIFSERNSLQWAIFSDIFVCFVEVSDPNNFANFIYTFWLLFSWRAFFLEALPDCQIQTFFFASRSCLVSYPLITAVIPPI